MASLGLTAGDLLSLFESTTTPQILLRADSPLFTIVAVSDSYELVSGCQRAQMLGRSLFQVFPDNPEDPNANGSAALRASFERVISTKLADQLPVQRYDVEMHGEHGGKFQERYWNATNNPVLGADGSLAYIIHKVEEVTEIVMGRKKAQEARQMLAQTEQSHSKVQSLREAQRAGRIGSFEWFLQEDRALFTPELEALYGLKEGTMKPGLDAWSKFVVPQDFQRVVAEITDCLARRSAECGYEFRAALPDGTTRWLRGQAQMFYDQTGVPDRMIGVNIDIEAQKQTESHLRQTEDRLRAIFDGTNEYVGLLSPDGIVLEANRALLEFGVNTREELIGRPFWDLVLFAHTPEAPEKFRKCVAQARAGHSVNTELMLNRSDGQSLTFDFSLHPVVNEWGEVVLIVPEGRNISKRKAAEEQLLQQWQAFDSALSNLPDFIYTFDLEGRITYANAALLTLLQKPLDSVVGKTFFDLEYPMALAQRLAREIAKVIETKQPITADTPFTGASGVTRQYEYIFVPVLDSAGVVKSVAGSTRDITERTKASEIVQDDRRRWRDLLQQTPASIAILKGAEHTLEWVNDQYVQLVGRTVEEILGKGIRQAAPEAEDQPLFPLLDGVYRSGEPVSGREVLINLNRNGHVETAYINFVFLPNRDAGGSVDGVFMHITDVSDMVLARKQVEENERQFRTLAESIPHLAWMADENGFIFWYNRRWYEYTGTTYEQMAGWQWQSVHDPKVLPDVMKRWQAAIHSGEPFEMTFPLKSAGNVFRSFLTRCEPVKDKHGKVVRWFGTNTDITEQQETEDQLRRMNRELEEFAFVASHDLQEPLRMVNIYTQLLLRKLNEDGKSYEQYAKFVRQGVDRIETLLRDLLSFSRSVHIERIEHGNADLQAALSEAMSVLHGRIEEAGALITAGPMPSVRGETAQMAHVFQNLLSNALKYRMPDVPPQIDITAHLENHEWIVSVKDNGIGFAPQYAEHIFGLFKRLYKQEYEGTGLGLAICKRIIERYGGRIWAESALGDGATFHFALPIT